MIRKFHEAKISGGNTVTLWGDGSPYREFLYSEDLAGAVTYLMENCNAKDLHNSAGDFINIGTGKDMSIKQLAETVRTVVYEDAPDQSCIIKWDSSKPNGTPKKLLDVSRLFALGFEPETSFLAGVKLAYRDYIEHHASE
jgi:GDP-L-fucose synthase